MTGGAGVATLSMLRVGHSAPLFLLFVFATWVLAPFVFLAWANIVSKRWPIPIRATLRGVTLVLTLISSVIYGDAVLRPAKSTPAFVFMVVPLASWLLLALVLLIARHISREQSRPGSGVGS